MDSDGRRTVAAIVIGTVVPITVGMLSLWIEERPNRKMQKQLTKRKLENAACMEKAWNRLADLARDPCVDGSALMLAWQEETKFLNILRSQPL